ncbi:MAG: hypothetical protein EBQ86_07860, partial [Betaproteobacteria bacterium]|nr:hypothetical protein [Betaproteobacteria bacterium]
MGWLRDWKRKRLLQKHAIDATLWRRVTTALPFLAGLPAGKEQRLKEMAIVFLAEKSLSAGWRP